MRGFILSLFLIICTTLSFAQTQVAKKTSYGSGYLEFLPADYTSSSSLYPCIIFLHGSGERGDGSPAALEKLKAQGIPKNINNGSKMCFTVNGKTECFIVLSPQTNDWFWKNTDGTTDVMPFVKYALQTYRIDPDRIYLTGLSMGGEGAWYAASYSDNEPNYFAAIAPTSAKADYTDGHNVANKKIPVWAFHGDADASNSVYSGQRPVQGMIDCNANPAPIWTLYPGLNHGQTWTRAYTEGHTYHNPNMYEWFLTQKRNPNIKPPITNAGVDIEITLPTNSVALSGKASDTDGTVISTVWKEVTGPNTATLSNINSLIPTISNLKKGTYNLSLTSTDNQGICTTDLIYVKVNPAPTAPVANAGADKTITLPMNSVIINGTGTDSDGTISTYDWTKTSGGAAILTNTLTSDLTASALVAGSYVFRLTVTDNSGQTHFDEVIVIVNPANVLPIANAGADKSITLPTNSIVINGTGADSDGTITSYTWTQTSGGAGTLTNTSTANLTASALAAGSYVFRLTVTDNSGGIHFDEVTITVNPANVVPAANAGADKTIALPTNSVVINGTGMDSDGTISSYAWAQTSGPTTVTTSSVNNPDLTVSNCVQGTYIFTLAVTDNAGATAVDNVSVIVSSSTNQPPVVSAGDNQTLTLPIKTTTLNSIASDPDGSIVSYTWTRTSGPAATLINANTSALSIIGTDAGTYHFRVTVTDDKGLKTYDNVNVVIKTAVPVANAGADQQITSPISETILQGIGTDADGTIISYAWTQSSGPAAIITNPTLPTVTVSQLTTTGEYVFLLTVTDNDNQKGLDYVKVTVSKSGTSQTSVTRSSGNQSEEVQTLETPSVVTVLNQNYPNPFSSNTTIPFTLENSQHVVVKVYDFFGAEIETLVNERLEAGEHFVTFTPSTPNQFFLIKLVANGKLFSVKATQL